MDDLMLNAERIRYGAFRENQDRYLKMSDIPLESYISDANAKTQTELVTNYNNIAEGILKKRGNSFENFKPEDWLALQQGRRFLEAEQERMSVDLARFKEMDKIVQSDQNKWDTEEWDQLKLDYLKNGRLQDVELPIRAQPLDFTRDKANGTQTIEYGEPTLVNGKWMRGGKQFSASEPEARAKVKNKVFSSEANRKWLLKEFNSLSEQDKIKYLDVNGDNQLSDAERRQGLQNVDNNPILRYAQDKYWSQARDVSDLRESSVEPPRTASGLSINLFGRTVKFAPGAEKQGSVIYGDETFVDPVEFDGSFKINNIPTRGGKVFRRTGTSSITSNGNIEGYLKNYDKERDVLILAATGTDPNIDNGTLVEIPASNFNQVEINKIPIVINGKQTTLGAIRETKPTTQGQPATVPTSGVNWK